MCPYGCVTIRLGHDCMQTGLFKNESDSVSPILRWVGGKVKIVRRLLKFLPHDIDKRLYREPFFGAGALFFALQPKKAFLSDLNEQLIQCYRYVRDNPTGVSRYLQGHLAKASENYYYDIRDRYNRFSFSAAQAARFIFLNKTCFNGIFRVNREGKFNVPYGWKEPPHIPTCSKLKDISSVLQRSKLDALSYEKVLGNVSARDFFYLDPPYPPLNGTSNFSRY